MKSLNNNTQILNIHYGQEMTSDILNKIFYSIFTAGVIEGDFSFTSGATAVTISSVSFLIHPQNQPELLVRIDNTEPITLTNTSPSSVYLIARYRWENENTGAEFIFIDDANIVETDVILIGLIIDDSNKIIALDYNVQERARVKAIQKDTLYPLISQLDGYRVGHDEDKIPVSDGMVNESLNAQYLNGKEVTTYAVSKEKNIISYDETSFQEIVEVPTYPEWMNVDAVNKGEGVTAEFLNDYKIQPQDGITLPDLYDKIPVANTIIQKELNAGLLNGYRSDSFAKEGHTHTLDELIEGSGYYNVEGMSGTNQAGKDSIEEDDITYREVAPLAYDKSVGQKYSPIYETGYIVLKGYAPTSVTFANASDLGINNARVFLQRIPASGEVAETTPGVEKRTARIMSVTTQGFVAQQMGSIKKNGSDYMMDDVLDADDNTYYYFLIGKKIEAI